MSRCVIGPLGRENYTLFTLHVRSNCIHPFLLGFTLDNKWILPLEYSPGLSLDIMRATDFLYLEKGVKIRSVREKKSGHVSQSRNVCLFQCQLILICLGNTFCFRIFHRYPVTSAMHCTHV